jgi:hypothetical protein
MVTRTYQAIELALRGAKLFWRYPMLGRNGKRIKKRFKSVAQVASGMEQVTCLAGGKK